MITTRIPPKCIRGNIQKIQIEARKRRIKKLENIPQKYAHRGLGLILAEKERQENLRDSPPAIQSNNDKTGQYRWQNLKLAVSYAAATIGLAGFIVYSLAKAGYYQENIPVTSQPREQIVAYSE